MYLINYHTHTYLCGHAEGKIDEYIEEGILRGVKEIGFADHAPIPERHRKGITMHPDEVPFYCDEITERKERYKDKVDIKLGFEVDFPLFDSIDHWYLSEPRLDFLIGSCHFLGEWGFDHPHFVDEFDKRDIDEIYNEYYSTIQDLVESRMFDIVGHFDLIKKFGHRSKKDFTPKVTEIARLMAKYGTVADINTAGLIKPVNEIYPEKKIIQIFFDNNVPVTISADTHKPEHIDYHLTETIELLKSIGYKKIHGFTKRKKYTIDI